MWYEKSYRRHLCDMHIEDWDDAFLSEFSPQAYYENLVRAKIQNAMIYFQSHVGYCYFPTKTGYMHKAFNGKEDSIKHLVHLCRRGGISVTGYYSLIYNNWAHDAHPQWRMVMSDGKSRRDREKDDGTTARRYGFCCPNNRDYRQFVFSQMKEMNDYFDFEGMFFDMLFWPHMCYCESCRERWAREVGGDIPQVEDWNNQSWLLHVRKRSEWMGEFAQAVTDEMKRLRPSVSVEHNFASAVLPHWGTCCNEPVNNACDYAGGDLYGGILEQSFTCKFYQSITRNQPFEYMFSRCEPNLKSHTVTKSHDMMSASVFLTCAHHGATLVIDAIDPVGTLDERVYERIGDIFEEEKKYEPFLTGEMITDAGVYYSLKSKYTLNGNTFANHSCAVNTVKTMIENHVSVGVTGGWQDLSRYKVLFASCLTREDDYDNDRIAEYVKNGGRLYFSGGGNPRLVELMLGARISRFTDENVVYIAPKYNAEDGFAPFNLKYPLPFNGRVPVLEGAEDCEIMASIVLPYTQPDKKQFSSIHSNPPGIATAIPAVIFKSYGKGQVIWSAAPIEYLEGFHYKKAVLYLMEKLRPIDERSLISDAPKKVELVSFRDENILYISAVHLNEEYEAEPLRSFDIKVRTSKAPKSVVLLPQEEEVSCSYDGNYVSFEAGKPFGAEKKAVFAMYKINL